MIYELINPSDKYTFEAAEEYIAAMVCLIVGRGMYPLVTASEPSRTVVPFFAPGINQQTPFVWYHKTYGIDPYSVFESNLDKIIIALDSFVIGDREEYFEKLSEAPDACVFMEKWEDENRSSMNNILQKIRDANEEFRRIQESKMETSENVQTNDNARA